jgi:hypothetical protein
LRAFGGLEASVAWSRCPTCLPLMFVALFAVIVFAIAGAMSWKWQSKTVRLLEKMDRNRPIDLPRKMSAGGDCWADPRSSGSRAF